MYQMTNDRFRKRVTALGAILAPMALAGSVAAAEVPAVEESIFSDSLRFTGRVVATLEDGREIRENAFLRGRLFRWKGRLEGLRAAPEEPRKKNHRKPDIAAMSVERLAEALRGVAMFQGHMFVEAKPPIALARKVKRLERLRRERGIEALRRELPAVPPSYGEAGLLGEREVEPVGGAMPDAVIGTDDRTVQNNFAYPHRVHIVFDNAGSSSVIDSSRGSGSLIGPSTAMSVAHVFWDEGRGTWEAIHRWAPGYDSADPDPSPWGEWTGCYWVTIPTAYTRDPDDEYYDFAVIDFNVGCNSVRNGVNSDRPGATVGWLGHYTASVSEIESRTGYLRGYPGTGLCGNPAQPCGTRIWGDHSLSNENNVPWWPWWDHVIEYQADTSGGQSGSAFYHYADPACAGCGSGAYLVGMHFHGHDGYNDARRFDSTVLSFMRAYSSDY